MADPITVMTTFVLAVASVSMWTLRVALTSAGKRTFGAAIAGVEALVFTVAFGRIVTQLDDPVGMAAYALGVTAGTLLGLAADERLSGGQSLIRVIVEGDGALLSEALMGRRWPVTATAAVGPSGPVAELVIAVDDGNVAALLHDVDDLAPGAFRTVERLRSSYGRALPANLRQIGELHRLRIHPLRGSRSSTSVPDPIVERTAVVPS
jgi:uncharacterized protein YebE (UPF0316 family)